MKRSHPVQQKGDKKMRKQILSPHVEKFLFPNGRPSIAKEMEDYCRSRIRNKAVLEFLIGKRV